MIDDDIQHYCFTHTKPEPEYLEKLVELSNEHMEHSKKISGRVVSRLLKILIGIQQPKNILEIGMFTGYSALSMAENLPDDGQITCLESSPKAIEFAKEYFKQTPKGHLIDIKFGHAIDTIIDEKGPFDLVFIDADKRNYQNYYNMVFPKVKVGGLIIIDNVLWDKKVLQPEEDSDFGVVRMNDQIVKDPRVENVLLSIRDGVNLVRKIADLKSTIPDCY